MLQAGVGRHAGATNYDGILLRCNALFLLIFIFWLFAGYSGYGLPRHSRNVLILLGFMVPRDRIELPTRGFSILFQRNFYHLNSTV
jgi:hypothetical protein